MVKSDLEKIVELITLRAMECARWEREASDEDEKRTFKLMEMSLKALAYDIRREFER